jgi:tellurite resistance protein TerC
VHAHRAVRSPAVRAPDAVRLEGPARMNLPLWFEISTFVGLSLLLLGDLLIVSRRPHEPSMRESALWVGVYVALALLFGVAMLAFAGGQSAAEFYAGWLTEYSLSIDNLFVFVIIMARFAVPRTYQQQVLMIGIIMALVLRGIFIIVGAAAINRFAWVFWIFGAFLIYTAIKLAMHKEDDEDDFQENLVIRRVRSVLPMQQEYDGARIRTVVNGKKLFTPMLIVFIAIASTDLLFALDSIPAIFGLTQEPFIVFTANVFALMGLRQLYFLLGGLLDRLVYLSMGLAVVLGFIGVKLIMHAVHENTLPFINGGEPVHAVPEIPIWLSLAVIVGTLVVATVASLAKTRRDERADLASGAEPLPEGGRQALRR